MLLDYFGPRTCPSSNKNVQYVCTKLKKILRSIKRVQIRRYIRTYSYDIPSFIRVNLLSFEKPLKTLVLGIGIVAHIMLPGLDLKMVVMLIVEFSNFLNSTISKPDEDNTRLAT